MTLNDEDLPVLNVVVHTGDESVIRSTRTKLNSKKLVNSEFMDTPQFELPAHLESMIMGIQRRGGNSQFEYPSDIEDRIEQIVDKHIVALRKELRILLHQA